MNAKIFKKFSLTLVIAVAVLFSGTAIAGGLFVSQAYAASLSLKVDSPNGGAGEYLSGIQNITWTSTNGVSGDKIDIAVINNDTSTSYEVVSGINYNASPFTMWDTADRADGSNYTIKILKAGTGTVYDESDHSFTIDNTAPTLVVNDGTATGPVQSDTINVTVADATSGVASQEYGFSTNATCDSSDTITTSFTSGTDFYIAGNHTDYLCVKATDNAGNVGYKEVGQLNTDNTAPIISSIVGTTIQGSGSNHAGDTIAIKFDEPVAPASGSWSASEFTSIADNNNTASPPFSTVINLTHAAFSYNSNSNTLTITLNEQTDNSWLRNGDTVTVTPVTQKIEDIAGNYLPITAKTSSVITGDVAQPTVTLTYSPNGPVKDGTVVTVTATFNEMLFPGSSATPTIAINVPGSGNVSVINMTPPSGSGMFPLVWTYDWTVTNGGTGTAYITIATEDLAGNANAAATNRTITVDNIAPMISTYTLDGSYTDDAYFNPNNPDTSLASTTIRLKATELMVKFNDIYLCHISVTTCGSSNAVKTFIDNSTFKQTSTQVWDGKNNSGNLVANGAYKIGVDIVDQAGNPDIYGFDANNPVIVVDTVDPTMSISAPTANQVVHKTNGEIPFTFSATDTNLDTCAYKVGTGSYTNLPSCTSPQDITLVDGRQTVILKATDKADNTKTDSVNFVVDTDGTLTVDNATGATADFKIIQNAINAAVSGITTIQVAAGTYPENVTINQPLLNLEGAQNGVNVSSRTATSTNESVIKGAMTINADNVNVNGFTITNPNGLSGISIGNYTEDNIIYDIFYDIGGFNNGIAHAVSLNNGTNFALISDSSFNNISALGGATAIFIGPSSATNKSTSVHIYRNKFSNINTDTTSSGSGAYGILANNGVGVPDLDVEGNTFSNLEGLWVHAIGLEGSTEDATIENNTFSDLIGHKNPSDAVAVHLEDNPKAGTVTINYNKFDFGYTQVGVNSVGHSIGTVDATNNWWGDASGPYNPRANSNGYGASVYPSIADEIATSGLTAVNFNPFYNSDALADLVSVNPITHFNLSFVPISQTVGSNSTLTITAKDLNGVTVVNRTPYINITEAGSATFPGGTLPMLGATGTTTTTITDNVPETVNVNAQEVGGSAAGTGTITFTAGTVVDNTPPVITLLGQNPMTLTVGDTYTEPGATANDNVDGDITSHITVGGDTVDTAMAGIYAVTYNVSDAAGNAAVTETRTVIVVSPVVTPIIPTITLDGTIVPSYTATDAGTRFTSGLQFNTTDAASATVNGASATIDSSGVITAASASDAITLGLHVYNVIVTSSTGDTAYITVAYNVTTTPVTPVPTTIALYGDAIASPYTVTEATTRFADGLQFTMTGAHSVTVNGVSAILNGDTTTATTTIAKVDATTLGLHVYNLVVISPTGDTAYITVAYQVNPVATLGVTSVTASSTIATANGTFTDGWRWTFNVTVPLNETHFSMEFKDFKTSDGAHTIAAANNIRIYSAQSSDASSASSAKVITAAQTFSTPMTLNTDLDPSLPGRQIHVVVEMKVPTGSAGASYSSEYAVKSL